MVQGLGTRVLGNVGLGLGVVRVFWGLVWDLRTRDSRVWASSLTGLQFGVQNCRLQKILQTMIAGSALLRRGPQNLNSQNPNPKTVLYVLSVLALALP